MHDDIRNELERKIAGEVRCDPYSRVLYGSDASNYYIEPLGVVLPRSGDDLSAIVEIAARYGLPLLARGGGTSLAGQAVGEALVVDCSKYLNRILEIDPERRLARVEPGVVCDTLNAALRPHSLMFGPDPASANRATAGGMIGNNAAGSHSILYGMTADHLQAAEVLLADGTRATFGPAESEAGSHAAGLEGAIYREAARLAQAHAEAIKSCYPRTWRRASGYALNYLLPPHGFAATRPPGWGAGRPYPDSMFNLAKLLCGAEGTLAVVREATFSLVPRPKMTAVCAVHCDSLTKSAEATPAILETSPSAVELVDQMMIDLTRAAPAFAPLLTFVHGRPAALLIVEYYGESEAELLGKIEALEARLRRQGLADTFVRAVTAQQQANVWGVRKAGLGLLLSRRGPDKPVSFIEDCAVPVERLADFVSALEALFAAHGVTAGYYAHASAGCLHIRPVLDLKTARGVETMQALAEATLEIVMGLGGAMSGEHGDGLSRSGWNERLFGAELYGAFRELKRAFDPHNRLNPGKVVDAPPLTEHLRFGADYRTREVRTYLDFSRDHGLAGALEMCNGSAECRKEGHGAMCPSYMATREEEHSTRGRANALRAALAGALPAQALTEKRMYKVMELCVECKACKAECSSSVDMAKIKYEFLAQYNARHGIPLRARLFGNFAALARLACRAAPLVNWAAGLGPTRALNERLLGISRRRTLPPFAAEPFEAWQQRRRGAARENAGAKQVVLFLDTFNNYNHPEVARAAVRLLEAAGHDVLLAAQKCCGRPLISKGMLEQARAHARHNVRALAPFAARGTPIVGLEPSCLLTLRDEYLDLLPGDRQALAVAEHALLIEEYLVRLAEEGALDLRWKPANGAARRVLAHAHCYQKALSGTRPLLDMLRLPGWEVSEIASGCCGMAGSFGYEAEHYDLSLKIGEDRLFPAVRAAGADTRIAAAGMSCRHQIAHATGRMPAHPVELLAEALA